jgi:V/A-type H+-transporting ATPase subunit C
VLNVIRYAGVNSRVKSLIGKMLEDDDYKELLNSESVQEIFNYLKENTTYQNQLEKLSGQEVHRRKFEKFLKKNFVRDYQVILPYLVGDTRSFFKSFFTKFEVDELKLLLRTALIEDNKEYLQGNLVYLNVREGIEEEKVVQINNYNDLLTIFIDTPFYEKLKKFEDRYKENQNLFPIEMTLDFQYFMQLERLARHLSRDDYRVIKELLGTKVDLLNINFIYRIKKFYDLELEEIISHIIPYHYRLSAEELKSMARLDEAEDIFEFLEDTAYDRLFTLVKEDRSVLFEKYFLSYLLRKAIHIKATGDFNIGVILAYLFIKEYEIRDIITIVEGVRYKLDKEEINKYLIRDWV